MKKLPILLFTLLAAFALQAGAQDVAALKAELAEIKKRVATMEKLLGMSAGASQATAAAKPAAKPAGDTTAAAGAAKVVGVVPEGMAPIPLELPKPMFKGTPVPAKGIPNLRKPRGSARAAFIAPKGTKNVALNKEVTSSDDFPVIGELEMITDDDKDGSARKSPSSTPSCSGTSTPRPASTTT